MNTEELQIVLKEVLEELQATNKHLAAQHDTIEEINQKISGEQSQESFSERLRLIETSYENERELASLSAQEMSKLRHCLELHAVQLLKPVQHHVKHYHHFHKGLIAAGAFFITTVILFIFLVRTHTRLNEIEAADIKYRHLHSLNNPSLNRIIYLTDSLYLVNPDSLQKAVILKEAKKQRQLELILKASLKEAEARQLRKEAAR